MLLNIKATKRPISVHSLDDVIQIRRSALAHRAHGHVRTMHFTKYRIQVQPVCNRTDKCGISNIRMCTSLCLNNVIFSRVTMWVVVQPQQIPFFVLNFHRGRNILKHFSAFFHVHCRRCETRQFFHCKFHMSLDVCLAHFHRSSLWNLLPACIHQIGVCHLDKIGLHRRRREGRGSRGVKQSTEKKHFCVVFPAPLVFHSHPFFSTARKHRENPNFQKDHKSKKTPTQNGRRNPR